MGLYDRIVCEYPLPGGVQPSREYQTKDTPAQYLETYRITADGRLVHEAVRYETVPEEQRPYYGTDKWNDTIYQLFGCQRKIPLGDVDIEYHGDINFYSEDQDWVARFTNGKLQEIRFWPPPPNPDAPPAQADGATGDIGDKGDE